MIQLFITGVRVGFIATTMVTTLSMITFAQTIKPTIENTPTATRVVVTSDSLKHDKKSTERDTSVQTDPPAGPAISAAENVEIQHRFNELRRELLDDRASYINRWLDVIAIVLAVFSVIAVVVGYIGFKRFQEIKTEAEKNVTAAAEHAEEAERLVDEIKKNRDESAEIMRSMTAEDAVNEPEEAKQAAANVDENPMASLIDKAIAQAIFLQQQGNRDEAIEKWRAVAHIAEEIDNDQAARAMFSVGYLLENPEDSISAYDRAIRRKPDLSEAYYNRGLAKVKLERYEEAIADYDEAIHQQPDYSEAYNNRGAAKSSLERYEEAIVDYNEAIRLKPNDAAAYNSRGVAKVELGLINQARQDFEKAQDLARDAGNDRLADLMEQLLRALDSQEDE